MGFKFWIVGIFFSFILHGLVALMFVFINVEDNVKPREISIMHGELFSLADIGLNKGGGVPDLPAKEETPDEPVEEETVAVEDPETPEIPKIIEQPEEVKQEEKEPEKTEPEKPKEERTKDAIPLETIKKEPEKKPEPTPKTEEKKEKPKVVAKPTPKPKPTSAPVKKPKVVKATPKPAPKKDNSAEMKKILDDIKMRNTLKQIKRKADSRRVADVRSPNGRESGGSRYGSPGSNRYARGVSAAGLRDFGRRLVRKISANWEIPPTIPIDGTLEARVFFLLDGNGNPSRVRIGVSSGNPTFDKFCVNAIYKSSPLYPPPPELRESLGTEGIDIGCNNKSAH